jgi:enoyl-[acyl-carrier protein] reductase/trans-2-enoyl-CoA reductase (NAD+)
MPASFFRCEERAVAERLVSSTGRGFLLLDAHPAGCLRSVADMRAKVSPSPTPSAGRRVALVIGSSAGYGLAATIAGLVRYGVDGVGVGFERPPGRRTATAGWYRTIATDKVAMAST